MHEIFRNMHEWTLNDSATGYAWSNECYLSQISNKTSRVKAASMFKGMAAARHLGKEIAEDFGGGDA